MSKLIKIGIIDYGVGNHASLVSIVRSLGYNVKVSNQREYLDSVDVLILPGVGALPYAMEKMREHDLIDFIKSFAHRNKLIIGICLGMQILADYSSEGGGSAALGLISGKVIPFASEQCHIGWSDVVIKSNDSFEKNKKEFYFNHSYRYLTSKENVYAECKFGEIFPAIIKKGNTIGLQFHPEKSQENGRKILRQILEGQCFG